MKELLEGRTAVTYATNGRYQAMSSFWQEKADEYYRNKAKVATATTQGSLFRGLTG